MFQRAALVGIVATLMFVPLGALLGLACVLLLDVPLHTLLTFRGALSEPAGLLAWWLLAWLPAAVYVEIISRRELEKRGAAPNHDAAN